MDEERRRKRRQRRRRKQAKRRRERRELERKVPQHLRLAHAKARSITERFLGLLRAEVEKVTLFAQSRLGELADTAGSLRFPSCDDSEFGSFSSRPRPLGTGYDHPLSDGGMHPSASSSDDEHGTGVFPWSDSSDDESDEGSRPGASPAFGREGHRKYSAGNLSSMTDQAANLTRKRAAATRESNRNEQMPSDKSKNSAFDAAQRQISQFTAIRCEKPTFQRNDHIVGEDLLLLSAVDEVDGFTAVGVELMHVLRFISDPTMLNSLPEALIDSVLSFCAYKDILKVATLNSDCRDHVEAFCGRQLAKMQERHPVDSSWQFRLGMQVNRLESVNQRLSAIVTC
jgi:hypothetical protein